MSSFYQNCWEEAIIHFWRHFSETLNNSCSESNENLIIWYLGCNQIPIEYLQWNETTSLVAMGIACLGFIMTLFAMIVFIRHNDTPIVKASTRELSYVIMIGMFLCHGTTFTLLAKPTKALCYVSRVLPGLSFAIMYAALVTKTNRIARILAGSKKRIITKKPRFMSGTAQVVITFLLISIECGIIATMLVREPADKMHFYPTLDKVQLICNTTPLGMPSLNYSLIPINWIEVMTCHHLIVT